MKVLIIYDSVFGNTKLIAQAMGNSLGSPDDVGIYRVSDLNLKQLEGVELLIVGSPTRGFRPTEATMNFLKNIPENYLSGIRVAAFDTRISLNDIKSPVFRFLLKTGGFAAKPIANWLEKKGGKLIVPPEGFFVNGEEGPMKGGELERAMDWAKKINDAR